MRTPITVVRCDSSGACSALARACSVATVTPSAPKDCANFSQSMLPSCTPCAAMPLATFARAELGQFGPYAAQPKSRQVEYPSGFMQGGLQTRPYRIQASIHAQRPASIVCTQNRVMVFGEAGAGV